MYTNIHISNDLPVCCVLVECVLGAAWESMSPKSRLLITSRFVSNAQRR